MANNERDELKAILDDRGVEYDGRAGLEKLRQLVADTAPPAGDQEQPSEPGGAASGDVPDPGDASDGDAQPPAGAEGGEDEWPKQIAPLAWLDQAGRRYTDLGEAQLGAEECRGQT